MISQFVGRRVFVLNDADAAGLAEAQYGAAAQHDGLVLVTTLGTGIGSALIIMANWYQTPNSVTLSLKAKMQKNMRHLQHAYTTV